ncbi:MAG: phosphate ABC transporter substrate-binding protein PstS [Thermoplasmata archaeon]
MRRIGADAAETNDSLTGPSPRRGRGGVGVGMAIGIAVVLLAAGLAGGYVLGKSTAGGGGGSATTYTLTETGSTLIYPYMNLLGPNFTAIYPNVAVSPQGTGSGAGISAAEQGTVDMGGTDAYLLPSVAAQYGLINVPIAISSQLIFYNLPGLSVPHLNLNGTIIAMIWSGAITRWDDPLIAAANPGVSLPSTTITPLHRSDGSGDTFMFTSLCYLSWKGWPGGYGTTYSWLPGQPGYQGNAGMVTGLQATPGGIAYIGISYLSAALADGLHYAALGDQAANQNGTDPANYVLPTATNISEDANLALQNLEPPSVAISLILGGVPGATDLAHGAGGTLPTAQYPTPYPDTNLEYILISLHPSNPTLQKYVVAFLQWAISTGATPERLATVNFLPLTPEVIGYDMQALSQVPIAG